MTAQAPPSPGPVGGPSAPSGEVPLFYRRGFRNVLQQAIYVAATAIIAWYVYTSLDLRDFGFGFLSEPAGFAVGSQWLTDVDGVTNSRLTMYLVGVWSSLRAVLVGILLATFVGVAIGVARLSSNFLVAKMATLFVEIFRNTPLLVQVVLWYAILLVGAPKIQEVVNVGDFFFLSNRGIAIPWPVPSGGLWGVPDWFVGVWVLALIAAALVALKIRATRQERERETGQPHYPNRWAFSIFSAAALISFLLLGVVVSIDRPILSGTQYAEGMVIKPEFAALVLGLTAYTGAFIAEIVRGSIQALPRGQTEAANAIGLSGYQRLTLIILPQALRQMIPSVTNQYLNVNKNSSLAYAVLYDDLFRVATVIQNKAGHALEMFFVIIVTYMIISFAISAVMNVLNSRVTAHRL
jgi:general L-amino acid transport system permease protein